MFSMKFLKITILVLVFTFVLSTAGSVFGSWLYYLEPTGMAQGEAFVDVGLFDYPPEEVLPGDKEATNLHENHFNLINSIVNHVDYGLNASKKPIIRELLLANHGVVYGDQNVSGGNLKHMLLNTSDVNALMYVVEYVSDTEFIAYTFHQNELGSGNLGAYIEVYKTIIVKDGKWKATTSYKGKAKVVRPGVVSYSIDVKTWEYVH